MSARVVFLGISLFLLNFYGFHLVSSVSWYQGCFRLDPEDAEAKLAQPFTPSDDNPGDLFLVSCARRCWKTGWILVAIRQDVGCLCLNDTTVLQKISDSWCTLNCSPEDWRLSTLLPACGGPEEEVVSVYRTSGPYLVSASTEVTETWVVSSIPQTLKASAHLAAAFTPCQFLTSEGESDDSEDSKDEEEKERWQREVVFVWEVGGQREETVIRACTPSSPVAHAPYTFNHTGHFVIELTVKNALSSVRANHRVTVLPPRPWGLRLSPYHQPPLHTPSCLNHHYHHHHHSAINNKSNNNIERESDGKNRGPKLRKKTVHNPFPRTSPPYARPTCDNPIPLLGQEVGNDDPLLSSLLPPLQRNGGERGGREKRRGGGRRGDDGRKTKDDEKKPIDSWPSSEHPPRPPPRVDLPSSGASGTTATSPNADDDGKDTPSPTTTTTITSSSSTTPSVTAPQQSPIGSEIARGSSGRSEEERALRVLSQSQQTTFSLPHQHGKQRHARWAELAESNGDKEEADNEDDDDDEDVAEVAAFVGETFDLLAGVRTGLPPRFRVARVDRCRLEDEEEEEEEEEEGRERGGEGVVVGGLLPLSPDNVSGTPCPPDDKCLTVVKSLVFPKPGVYLISVIAWNQFGQDVAQIRMVVMDRRLGSLALSVHQHPPPPSQPHAPDAAAAVFATNHTFTFSLSLRTADRYNSILYVAFGDGRYGFALLRETKSQIAIQEGDPMVNLRDRMAALKDLHHQGLSAWEHLPTKLAASYGNGCELSVEFPVLYSREGLFTPLVMVVNNVTGQNVTDTLSSPLHVLNRLQNARLRVKSPVAAGERVHLSLSLEVTSSNLTVQWVIMDKLGQVMVNKTTRQTELSMVFHQTEVHRVTAVASNPLGKAKASASIHVQRSIGNVLLFCNPNPPQITAEEEIECRAEAKGVDHVTFRWNFGESGGETEVESTNVVSRASHQYLTPGLYNITVLASNNVSSVRTWLNRQVLVDSPVRCLTLGATLATPGEAVLMQVTTLGGTRMRFDFGRNWEIEDIQYVPPKTTATVSRVYDVPGVHPVKVYAHNAVSSAELTAHVVVQPVLGELQLELQATTNTSAVLVVQQGGKVAERKDTIFHLHFSDGTRIISASPVVGKIFTTNGTHTVNFTAFNQVDSLTKIVHVDQGYLVGSPEEPRLYHEAIVAQNDQTVFTILGCPKTAEVIEVLHSDGTRKVFAARTSNKWSHVFSSPGVQSVEVTIYGGRTGGAWRDRPSLHTLLLVQQPIKRLQLTGPTHVGIGCYNVWKAKVLEGTHMVCQWSFGGELENHFTTILQYGRSFDSEGVFTLGIHCHNDISQASAAVNITVYYPITDIRLKIPVTVHTHPTPITATVHAGQHFTFICNFGDGNVEEYDSSRLNLVPVPVQFPSWQEPSPVYNVTIQHLYADVGTYNVSVTVSNEISFLTRHRRVYVEEAIGDIEMFAAIPEVIDLNKKVEWTFTAVVGSGRNLQFAWVFDDRYSHDSAISEGNTSIATHEYDRAGEYEVMVKVSNHLQKTPVLAHFPSRVVVQERLSEVTLLHVNPVVQGLDSNQTYGAYFSADDNQSDLVIFEARTTESPVTFLFHFGDGQTEEVEGMDQMTLFYAAQAKHRYLSEGVFTVTVTASNALSRVEATLSHAVYVQVPVLGPLFEVRHVECVRFGQISVLTAKPKQGSNVTFDWKLDDETQLVQAGPVVRHQYRKPGLQTVEVTARNQVSNTTTFFDVNIVEQIQSVQIHLQSPSVDNTTGQHVVAVSEKLEHRALVTPRSPNIVEYYLWDFSFGYPLQSKEDTVWNQYHLTFQNRLYRVTVTAVNCHSNATSLPLEVRPMARIDSMVINTKGDKVVSRPIEFSAYDFDLTSVNTYTWSFGDGSPLVQTNGTSVEHVYERVGEYVVTLVAENLLGTYTVHKTLFVLTRQCEPPVVMILDPPSKSDDDADKWDGMFQMLESQSVYLESRVKLNCSASENLNYQWAVHHLAHSNWSAARITEKIDADLLRHPDLLLPPHSLRQGYYIISLRVRVIETEIAVYEDVEVKLEVRRSQLRSIIQGGALQQVSRGSTFLLDGSASAHSKDSPVQLKYNWTCRPLMQLEGSCLNESLVNDTDIPWNHSHLTLEAAWFTLPENFLFSLTVSATGSDSAVSDQVVQIKEDAHVIPLSVECKQCRGNWVNSDTKVTLLAGCRGHARCSQPSLRYTWTVFIVQGDDPQEESDPAIYIHSAGCVKADGSVYKYLMYLAKTTAVPTTTTSTPVTTTTTTTPQLVEPDPESIDPDLEEKAEPLDGFLVPPWQQDVKEQHASRGHAKSSSRGQLSRGSAGTRPHDNFFYMPIEEHHGSTRLGHKSRYNNGDSGEKTEGSSREGAIPEKTAAEGTSDPDLRTFDRVQPPRPHITVRKGSEMALSAKIVASDPEGPSLVFRPGALTRGRTYRVQVSVSDIDNLEWRGLAMTYFKVNKSPRGGRCSIVPPKGVEMDTLFKAFCKEWKDEQLPLRYELSYSLVDAEEPGSLTSPGVHKHVIYQGLSHQIAFTLPAGLPRYGRRVFLELSIRDSWGASTTICRLSVLVIPQTPPPPAAAAPPPSPPLHPRYASADVSLATSNNPIHQQLYQLHDDVKSLSRHLAASMYRGDVHGVQDSCQTFSYLVARLDRLATASLQNRTSGMATADNTTTTTDNTTTTTNNTTTDNITSATYSATTTDTTTTTDNTTTSDKTTTDNPTTTDNTTTTTDNTTTTTTTTSVSSTLRLISTIRFELLQTLRYMTLRDMGEVGRTLSCLQYATSAISQIDGQSFALGVILLEKISSRLRWLVREWETSLTPDVLTYTLQTVSSLLQAATRSTLMMEINDLDMMRFLWTQRSVDVVHSMLTLALQDHSLGELPLHHHTPFLTVTASHYATHTPSSINISHTTFHLPHNMDSVLNQTVHHRQPLAKDGGQQDEEMSGLPDGQCFQARATAFQQNPFVFKKKAPSPSIEIQSEVVSLDMFSCDGEQHLRVEKLERDNNVEIIIPLTSSVESDWEYELSKSQMNVHQFNISQAQENLYLTLLVSLAPIPDPGQPFPITAVISKQWPPHPHHDLFRQDFSKDDGQLRIFLSPNKTKDLLDGAGTYYFGLVETSLNSGRRRHTEVTTRNYTLSAWFGSCLFWDAAGVSWSERGCQVMPQTTTTTAYCRCNHLTTFGSHFELVPNDLSFTDIEHFFGLHENPSVMIMVGTVIAIYVVLLVIAWQADSHHRHKGGLVCLSDNNISDSQIYEVVLDTGLRQTAPNTAKISIILHGELGMSETRELISEDDRPMFDRSSRDRFLLTFPDGLGRIVKVQLWHNNAGASPRWFLTQVLVRDLNTGKVQFFLCEKWFGVDEGDGRVERELVALDNSVGFTQIFVIKWRQYMADFHAWGSVFMRPAHSHFTRAQRLSCLLSLLLSYMALNAMWYHRQPEQRRGEFGLLDVSWRSMVVGAICCAVVFPLHLFLAFLFRRSRVCNYTCNHKLDTNNRTALTTMTTATTTTTAPPTTHGTPTTTQAAANVASAEHADTPTDTVTSTQTLTTYSLLDQSILNWQSIQDWAQRQWVKRQQSTRSLEVSVKNNAHPVTQPCPTQPVQHTLLAGDETGSSGFEDAGSQATADRHRIKPVSESSSEGRQQPAHIGEEDGGGPHICLPAWCCYVAWVLCAVICTLSATVTILYGFRFGPTKSIYWLQSLYFSFMVCIFFAQPFWIIITVVCLALKNRNNPAVFDHSCLRSQIREGISAWHNQQKLLREQLDENSELERGVRARQRSRYLRFSRPPQDKVLQESRKKLMKEKNAASFLREVVVFVFMFTLVCVIAYGKDLSSQYTLKQSLDTMLLGGGGSLSYDKIENIPDWYQWARGNLLDAVYGTDTTPGLLMKDGQGQSNNVLIGHPFLRQVRVRPQPCPHSLYLPGSTHACRYGYSGSSQDVGGGNDSWTIPPGASAMWGEVGVYQGGGFAVWLNQSSKEEARDQLDTLEMTDWLDRQSRAVIVEMTILNAPTRLFSSVVLLLELPPSGGVIVTPRISSTYLFRYVSTWDNCVLACELLFVLLALLSIRSELAAMIEDGRHYFLWPWNYTQLLLCVTSLAYIVCYVYRFVLVSELIEVLRSTFYEQFVSLTFITTWDELLRSLMGLLVFLVVITRGLRLVRYCPHLAKFAAVYRRARREIMLLGVLFFILTGAFSSSGSLLFGSLSRSMRTPWSACVAVTALMTGVYSPPDLQGEGGAYWFPLFSLFSSTVACGLMTAYAVAALTHRVRVSKNGDLLVMGKCELLDFCLQQVLLFVGVRKHTPVHEPEVHLPPECTLAEFEYQVEELLFRMNALAGTTNLPEKPAGYLTDSDQSQAIGDDRISSGGSEPAVERAGGTGVGVTAPLAGGEEGRLEQRVQKIEDKLCANEPYLAQLLKLDSIGADILSQEKEKQLRSHLELEIFRQLQMRRQETGDAPAPTLSADNAIAGRPNTKTAQCSARVSDTRAGMAHGDSIDEEPAHDTDPTVIHITSSDDSPGSERALLRISEAESGRSKVKLGRLGGQKPGRRSGVSQLVRTGVGVDEGFHHSDLDPASFRHQPADYDYPDYPTKKPGFSALAANTHKGEHALLLSSYKHPEMGLMDRLDSARGPGPRKVFPDLTLAGMERADSLKVCSKKHFPDLASMQRSDSLRSGHKKHLPLPPPVDLAPIERSDSLRSAGKKPELPPKPTFAVLPVLEPKRSPKPPPLKVPTDRVLYRSDTGQTLSAQAVGSGSLSRGDIGGSGLLAESSSGSEQDTLFSLGGNGGRRSQAQGRRNLRKTKSRGKGKGAGTLTPTLLLDELSFTVHEPPKDVDGDLQQVVVDTFDD